MKTEYTKDGKPLTESQLRQEYHWVEDDNDVVLFVGNKTETLKWYKKHMYLNPHHVHAHRYQRDLDDSQDRYDSLPIPEIGKKWN
jgi:hypothetical protein